MRPLEVVLALLAVAVALATAARRLAIPYPLVLVVGGLALGLVPGLPRVQLEPDVVFLVFLPPLLYAAAIFTSWRDLRANARPIGLLAVGLVLTTMAAVAGVSRLAVPELPWAAAFALGAIVSPPDAVAATAVLRRLGVPRRIVTVLEGESLVNDATGLVAYRIAVAAAVTGTFSPAASALRFLVAGAGGVAVGLAVGALVYLIRRRLVDPPVETTISLLTPFASYLPAEWLGLSGVLAVVTTGLFLGRRAPWLLTPGTRLQTYAVWETVVFVLNGLVFTLIGLQLPGILAAIAGRPPLHLAGQAALVCLTAILVRFAWVFPAAYLPRWLSPRLRARDPAPPWSWVAVIGWAGMRGVVSLAAALALPHRTAAGTPFPGRDLVILFAFCVILATLVLQGLTLPALVRRLGVAPDAGEREEEARARLAAARAALARLAALAAEPWAHAAAVERLRARYEHRARHAGEESEAGADDEHRAVDAAYGRLRREVLRAEREAVIELRRQGAIGDETLHRLERELDLEEARLGD